MEIAAPEAELVANWKPHHACVFGSEIVRVKHRLLETGLFTRQALGRLIEKCPSSHLGIRAIAGEVDGSARLEGVLGDASGQEALTAIERGRIWMNIRRVMDWAPAYKALLDAVFYELETRIPGLRTFKRNLGVLISSPGARVPYHADIQGQSLWQVEGAKSIYLFPASSPFITPQSVERILLRETDETVPYESWFEQYATKVDLEPGDMVAWPLYAPHRVANHDCLNVSVTMEHWTDEIWKAYAVRYGNGVLRRTLGLHHASTDIHGLHIYSKAAAAFLWKQLGRQIEGDVVKQRDFRIDARSSTGLSQLG